jgi:hypothetical protein
MLETDSLRWLQGYLVYILMAPQTQVAFKVDVPMMVESLDYRYLILQKTSV